MESYIYLWWIHIWSVTLWYNEPQDKPFRFQQLLNLLKTIKYMEVNIYTFKYLFKYYFLGRHS
jgi:hypothetical protein